MELAKSFCAFAELTQNQDSPLTADDFYGAHDAVFVLVCHSDSSYHTFGLITILNVITLQNKVVVLQYSSMKQFGELADAATVKKTISALKQNGIDAMLVQTSAEAKKRALSLLPKGVEVMNMTSETLRSLSIEQAILASDRYHVVKNTLSKMDRKTQGREIQKLGAAPTYTIGSVHAVTEDGHVLIASNTGSQLPAYVYGAAHVIWVVGTQKIVKNTDEGMQRIYEYVLPLEAERARIAYGAAGSNVSKLLILNKEIQPGRITLIFVNEKLGF